MSETAVTISDRAAAKIAAIMANEPAGTVLRLSVDGGGCSGFQYRYDLVTEPPADDDLILRNGKATVLVDSISLPFLQGAQLDYVDDLIGQSFQVKNPNATASCGCGTSFSI